MDFRLHQRAMITAFVATATATVATVASMPLQPIEAAHLTVHEWGTFTSVAGNDGRQLGLFAK